jgi:hypothetical protein
MGASGTAEPGTVGDATTTHDLDALIDGIVAAELETLRQAFREGAEFALTRPGRRDETLHLLECPALEPMLDRRARWTEEHRRRLAGDREYRIPLPALLTRASAGALAGSRTCTVCRPNLSGSAPRPLKRLTAAGLRARHVGRILSTGTGESLGSIVRVTALTGPDLFGVDHDEIEVATSAGAFRYAPGDDVHLWDVPSDAEAIERKMRLFARLGTTVSAGR